MSLHYPNNFPPRELDLGSVVTLVGKANACLSRYDGLLESLVNPQVMLSPLVMKEAEFSSRIEGTVATANEVYQQQAGEQFDSEKDADIHEVLNYRSTLRLADDFLADRPLSLHTLRQMHTTLMTEVRGKDKNPGQFRTTQNWIGQRGCTIEQATYVPPSPIVLQAHLDRFMDFVNLSGDSFDPIVKAALIHAEFELIHPFDDGNGRIGRLLMPLYLMKQGSIVSPSLYLSGYLEAKRDVYYQKLENISRDEDWIGWVEFFLMAVIDQSQNNLELVRKIIDLYEQKKKEISDLLRSDQSIYILDMLFDTPIFRANTLHEKLDIQRQRAAAYIRTLKGADVIQEVRPASGRQAALLSFKALLDITDKQ